MGISALKKLYLVVIISTFVAACSSAERKADRSQAAVNKSQVELNELKKEIVEDYKKCVDESSNEEDLAKCEAHLKAAEGL